MTVGQGSSGTLVSSLCRMVCLLLICSPYSTSFLFLTLLSPDLSTPELPAAIFFVVIRFHLLTYSFIMFTCMYHVVLCLIWYDITVHMLKTMYSGTSLLRSPTGLGKSDLNAEVTLLQGVICTVEYNLGLSHGDCNGEVFLLVR